MKKFTRFQLSMERRYETCLSSEEVTKLSNDLSLEGWDVVVSRDDSEGFSADNYHLEAQRQVVFIDESYL